MINGVVAPPLLILIILLGSDRRFMQKEASRTLSRTLTWTAAGLMSAAAMAMIAINWVFPLFGR